MKTIFKTINNKKELRESILKGCEFCYTCIGQTMGPKGSLSAIIQDNQKLIFTKDGATVAKFLESQDPAVNLAIRIIKNAATKTMEVAGDGTTTTSVLAAHMYIQGHKYLTTGNPDINLLGLKEGMEKATAILQSKIVKNTVDVRTNKQFAYQIAKTSANGDERIAKKMCELSELMIKHKCTEVDIEDSIGSPSIDIKIENGFNLPCFIKKAFLTTHTADTTNYTTATIPDVKIFLFNGAINNINTIYQLLTTSLTEKMNLLIVTADVDEKVHDKIAKNCNIGNKITLARLARVSYARDEFFQDAAAALNTKVFTEEQEVSKIKITDERLGSTKKMTFATNLITILNESRNEKECSNIIERIKIKINNLGNNAPEIRRNLHSRINSLQGKKITLHISAPNDNVLKEEKDRLEDAYYAVMGAKQTGIVPCASNLYLKYYNYIYNESLKEKDFSVKLGYKILIDAIKSPMEKILSNAERDNMSVIIDKIINNPDVTYGYDARKNEFCNTLERGIIDSLKTVMVSIENALIFSKLMLDLGNFTYAAQIDGDPKANPPSKKAVSKLLHPQLNNPVFSTYVPNTSFLEDNAKKIVKKKSSYDKINNVEISFYLKDMYKNQKAIANAAVAA